MVKLIVDSVFALLSRDPPFANPKEAFLEGRQVRHADGGQELGSFGEPCRPLRGRHAFGALAKQYFLLKSNPEPV